MQPNNTASKKKRFLIAAGIFLLPIIAIVITVISLLPNKSAAPTNAATPTAFNTHLPEPNLKKGEPNKFEVYVQAQQDSLKRKQEVEHDPYLSPSTAVAATSPSTKKPEQSVFTYRPPLEPTPVPDGQDKNEKKVNEHLQKLYAALNSPGTSIDKNAIGTSGPEGKEMNPEALRLQRLMEGYKTADTAMSPQLQQVNAVLDKVLAIKNAEKTPAAGASPANHVAPVTALPVTSVAEGDNLGGSTDNQNGFYGNSEGEDSTVVSSAIQAVVHKNQTIVSGAIVKLRLLQDIFVGSTRIPANSFIYGPCSINGERVDIQLTNAIYNGQIYPVSLKVFDGTDGLEGLYVPGAITRDVVKENMSQGIGSMNIGTFDPSLGAQAAAAGVETAKTLLSRKIRLVKANLLEGHIAILKNPSLK
jgi:conjugative transposon TraM protein